MTVTHYTQIPPISMDNETVRNVSGRLLLGSRDGAKNFCMRRFEIGPDGFTPRHRHDWEHEVYVLEGQGKVLIEGLWQDLQSGSVVLVPANVEHQFKNEGSAPFAFLCLVPSGAPEI